MEALDFLGPQRVMTLHNAGSSSAQVMALGLSDTEADVLVEVFGGRRSEAEWLTVKDAPDRAPLKIRGKLLVVSTIRERDAWAKKECDSGALGSVRNGIWHRRTRHDVHVFTACGGCGDGAKAQG